MTVKKKSAKRYPPLPSEVDAPAGLVRVEVAELTDTDGETEMGHFHTVDRVIRLRRKMSASQKWRVFGHELAHVWLSDSGLSNGLSHDVEEAIADAVASGLMRYWKLG